MAGTLTSGTVITSTISDGTNSTSATNCIVGSAKAWVNFDGTGTPSIRGAFNVSSITDNGTGNYTVNFTNPMPDSNYVVCDGPVSIGNLSGSLEIQSYTASSVSFVTRYSTLNAYDWLTVFIAVFR